MKRFTLIGICVVGVAVLCLLGETEGKSLSRVKRQNCHRPPQEHPTHRCNHNCDCVSGRTCSAHGFCHNDPRGKRDAFDDEPYGVNYQNDEDDDGDDDDDGQDEQNEQDEQQDEYQDDY